MTSIFLCHSSKDKSFVRKLADKLREVGVHVWLDEAEIKIGDSLTERIGQAITEMDYFGVVLSRNSIASEWVQRELQVAMQRELKERKVIVLPLLLEPVEIPPFLRDKLYADFTSSNRFTEIFPKLLKALKIDAARVKPEHPQELKEHRNMLYKKVKLTPAAVKILVDAANSSRGEVLQIDSVIDDILLKIGGKDVLNGNENNPRIVAEYREGLERLLKYELIREDLSNGSSKIYRVTNKGYRLADELIDNAEKK
jgi:hypothetical protein